MVHFQDSVLESKEGSEERAKGLLNKCKQRKQTIFVYDLVFGRTVLGRQSEPTSVQILFGDFEHENKRRFFGAEKVNFDNCLSLDQLS